MEGSQETSGCNICFLNQIPLFQLNNIDMVCKVELYVKIFIPYYKKIELVGNRQSKTYFESCVAMPIYLLVYIKQHADMIYNTF